MFAGVCLNAFQYLQTLRRNRVEGRSPSRTRGRRGAIARLTACVSAKLFERSVSTETHTCKHRITFNVFVGECAI